MDRLEAAMERARADGDMRIAMRLEEEFRKLYPPPGFIALDPDDDFDAYDLPDSEFDIGPPPSVEDLKALLDLLKGTPEGRRLRDLERELGTEEVLKALAEAADDAAGMSMPPWPSPPPKARRRPRKRRAQPKSADAMNPDIDENPPEQLKLF